jgi:phosphatidylinositol 4-kinase A
MTDARLLFSLSSALDHDPPGGEEVQDLKRLVSILLKDELFRVHTWLSPLADDGSASPIVVDDLSWPSVVRSAWKADPYVAVHMSERFISPAMHREIRRLVFANPEDVVGSPEAARILLGDSLSADLRFQLKAHSFYE